VSEHIVTTATIYVSRLIYIMTLLSLFRARTNVTEVYGELTDLDDIDWMKIANVDVSLLVFPFFLTRFVYFAQKIPGCLPQSVRFLAFTNRDYSYLHSL